MALKRNRAKEGRKRIYLLAGFAVILILAGMALIYTGFRLQWQEKKVQGHLLNLYKEQVALGISPLPEVPGEEPGADPSLPLPEDLVELPSDVEDPESHFDMSKLRPLGVLTIPRIKLEVVMVEGITPADLRFSVGHFPGTGLPGEKGNFALAGHRTFVSGQFFRRLDELEVGDRMEVEYGGKAYVYRVTQSLVVNPRDTWVLDPSPEATITLVTCTPPHSTAYRLIIRGVLEDA